MVVMEQLEADFLQPLSVSAISRVESILTHLHSHGFFHGDFRRHNIAVCEESDRVCVVDFDWAGKEGEEVVYPSFMNHTEIEWPPGADDVKHIKREHDEHWLAALKSEAGK